MNDNPNPDEQTEPQAQPPDEQSRILAKIQELTAAIEAAKVVGRDSIGESYCYFLSYVVIAPEQQIAGRSGVQKIPGKSTFGNTQVLMRMPIRDLSQVQFMEEKIEEEYLASKNKTLVVGLRCKVIMLNIVPLAIESVTVAQGEAHIAELTSRLEATAQ